MTFKASFYLLWIDFSLFLTFSLEFSIDAFFYYTKGYDNRKFLLEGQFYRLQLL